MSFLTNKIAIGSVQFGLNYGISNKDGITPINDVKDILKTAERNEVKIIDTAYAYGVSEKVLGEVGVEKFDIITKFIHIDSPDNLEKQFNESLGNLNVKKVYGYLAHRHTDILNNPKIWSRLIELKKDGLIQKIGFSLNNPLELEDLIYRGYIPDLIQVPYNYFDRRFEKSISNLKKEFGTEIHTRSTFLQGLFFINPHELNSHFNSIKNILLELKNENLTCQLLKFIIDKPFIDKVVLGVNNSSQLIENRECLNKKIQSLPRLKQTIPESILSPMNWPK